jgi:outer membrane protein insertion porin family
VFQQFLVRNFLLLALLCSAACGFPSFGVDVAFGQARVVGQIELEGVTVLQEIEVIEALDVGIDEDLSDENLSSTVNNLKVLYNSKGYPNARVSYRTSLIEGPRGSSEVLVTFQVEESLPVRIATVDFKLAEGLSPEKKKNWKQIQASLRQAISSVEKEVFDQAFLGQLRKEVEGRLISENLVSGRVVGVEQQKIDYSGTVKTDSVSEWVRLIFTIDPGERVTFGFRGNRVLSKNELDEIIDEEKILGLTSDYLEVIGEKIKERYRTMAFTHAELEVYTFESPEENRRHITYVINEGERVKIESIHFDGNFTVPQRQLRKVFNQKASNLVRRGYYYEKAVDDAVDLLVQYLQGEGFLSARVIAVDRMFVEGKHEVRVLVYLYEGERTSVREVSLEGFRLLKSEEVLGKLKIKKGEPLNLFSFSEGLEDLKRYYRHRGYLQMEILNEFTDDVVLYSEENKNADIQIFIEEGPLFQIGEIKVVGLEYTEFEVIERELILKTGDVILESNLMETEGRLRKKGLFSSVSLRLEDTERSDVKNVLIELEEAVPNFYGAGVGFRNDLGLRVFGEAVYGNLWRKNHRWSLTGEGNRRFENYKFLEYSLKMNYTWPWFLLSDLTFTPSLLQEKRQLSQFDSDTRLFNQVDVETSALGLSWQRPVFDSVPLVAGLTYSLERTSIKGTRLEAIDDQTLRIGAIIPSLALDYRDHPLDTTQGFYSSSSFEYAAPFLGAQGQGADFPISYTKWQFRADGYIPLAPKITWYVSFRTGIARNLVLPFADDGSPDPRIQIPIFKLFSLGGVQSMRGFAANEISVDPELGISGTLAFVNYRTRIDFPVVGDLRIGPFFDSGGLKVDHYSLRDLRHSAGLGLSYRTPVGPIGFDWGFKLGKRQGEDPFRFHLSVGIF